MRLTKLTDYAIRTVRALYTDERENVVSSVIAEKEHIPKSYVLTVLGLLQKAGVVESAGHKRADSGGGYKLLVDPKDVTLYDVIKITEGELKINACLYDDDECPNKACCAVHREFARINQSLIDELSSRSVYDILTSQSA